MRSAPPWHSAPSFPQRSADRGLPSCALARREHTAGQYTAGQYTVGLLIAVTIGVWTAFSTRAVAQTASATAAAGGKDAPAAQPLRPLGWHAYASRYIDPPVWHFEPVKGAVEYRAELRASAYRADRRNSVNQVYHVASTTPELSLDAVWKEILAGPVTASIAAVDNAGATLAANTLLFHKARPFDGTIPPWRYPIPEMVDGLAAYLINLRSPNAVEPDRSPQLWHAIIFQNGTVSPLGYPTHNAYTIEFFIDYAKWTKNADLARRGLALARELADFNIKYRTPADWKLPNVFYTTAVQGKMGGDKDRDALIVTLTGLMGRSLLRLGLDQSEPKYVRAAVDTARCLLETQLPEGNWPFRVEPKTGRVDNAYTSSVILPVLFFDELIGAPATAFDGMEAASLRESLKAARARAMRWLIEGPLRDYRWEGFCEDVADMPPYVATQWYDAAWTAKYLIEHRDEFPDQFQAALKVLDWIEDQFVCWHAVDVPYMESPNPVVPVVMEQYRCYRPVECCNAWLFDAYLAAHKATGKDLYLQQSRALAAALTHFRRPSGAFATWCFYTSPGRPKDAGDWFSCMVYDAHMMIRHEAVLHKDGGQKGQ